MPILPHDVEQYLSRVLKGVDWATIKAATPDLCRDCPQYDRGDDDPADPVCLSCPWWAVLYAHLGAEHWHPPRRPGRPRRTALSQEGGPDHD